MKVLDRQAHQIIKYCLDQNMNAKETHNILVKSGYNITYRAVCYHVKDAKETQPEVKQRIVGVIPDTHIPFHHPKAIEFIKDTFNTFGVTEIVHVGDLLDQYAFSRFGKSPNGVTPGDELKMAKEALNPWKEAFPEMKICIGNHDNRIEKIAKNAGLPLELLIDNYFDFPDGWQIAKEFIIDDVYYSHGTNVSGKNAALNLAESMCMSSVMGHIHTNGGVMYKKTPNSFIFGMCVGCLTDDESVAFEYSKDMRKKPVYGCGIVVSSTEAYFIPMQI